MPAVDHLVTRPSFRAALAFWAEPTVTVADINIGSLYEIPGDGNDRFFAEPDARLSREGVVRLVIVAPPRWRGFWAFCAPEHCSPAHEIAE
jgi:hypothetical protein